MNLTEFEERIPALYVASCEDGGAVPYVTSPPGWGKTKGVELFPARMKEIDPEGSYGIVTLNGATLNFGTMGGYLQFGPEYRGQPTSKFSYPWWWFKTKALVNGKLQMVNKALEDFDGGVIFIDEADKMQADERKTTGEAALTKVWFTHLLPPGWVVWFAGNRMTDRSGSLKEFDHLINRRREIPIRKDVESWAEWARRNLLLPEIITFGETHPLILFQDKPDVQGPWCTPRSLHAADIHLQAIMRVYQLDKIPTDPMVEEELAGGIGSENAAELIRTIRMGLELPSYDSIISNPMKADIPVRPDGKRLMAYRLASILREEHTKQALMYIERFDREFQTVFVRLAINTNFNFLFEKNFGKWCEKPENAALVAIVERYKLAAK